MHLPQRPSERALSAIAFLACLTLASCTAPTAAAKNAAGQPLSLGAFPPATLTVTPVDKAADVRLDTPISIESGGGAISSVLVHAPDGTPIGGKLSTNNRSWTSTAGLDASTTYTIDAAAMAPDGSTTKSSTTFTTMGAERLTTDVWPADGSTVGVGAFVKLTFNTDIPADNQANLVSHIVVTSAPSVRGAWHWFSDSEVHFRPLDYWPAGTHFTVTGNLMGVDAGNGYWGLGTWASSYTVGDKHVSTIDAAAHQMTVESNDQVVYTWPVSTGTDALPTISGNLVILYQQQDVLMDSLSLGIPRDAPNGYYDHVFWDTAISLDGFFIHAAPWSEWAQGYQNVSHGCVNLSTDRATTFYQFSQIGDMVIIQNTSRVADEGDGEGDWQIPADQYGNSGGQIPTPPDRSHTGGGL